MAGGWFNYGEPSTERRSGCPGRRPSGGTTEVVDPCEEDEASVTLIYTAIDTDCGDALTVEQVVSRDDNESDV